MAESGCASATHEDFHALDFDGHKGSFASFRHAICRAQPLPYHRADRGTILPQTDHCPWTAAPACPHAERVDARPTYLQVHSVMFPNYEALPEHENVVDPAKEVTLFKVAVDHIDRTPMMQHYKEISHGNPNYFVAYSNGKSLARVLPGLRSHGAHRWQSYNGSHETYTHPQAGVLHYTYNRYGTSSE